MIRLLAIGLARENPFVYLFFFMLLYPPIMIIIFAIIDWIKRKKKGVKEENSMKDKMNITAPVFPQNPTKGETVLYFGNVFVFDGTKWIDCGEW